MSTEYQAWAEQEREEREREAERRLSPAQCYAAHVADIKRILTAQRCMDSKGQIRAWKRDTWPALHAAGHTSLDPKACQCAVRHNDKLKRGA